MYRCLECGQDFEEPIEWIEHHGLTMYEGYGEPWSGCPFCLGDYEEVWVTGECSRDEC